MTIAQIPTASVVEDVELGITDIPRKVKICYSLSSTVKCLAYIDFIFSLIFAFGNMYFLIPVMMSVFGYLGAQHFNKTYTLIYFTYIFFINIIRLLLFINAYFTDPIDERTSYVSFIFLSICTLLEFWISRVIYRFYYSMKDLTLEELYIVKNISDLSNYYTILW